MIDPNDPLVKSLLEADAARPRPPETCESLRAEIEERSAIAKKWVALADERGARITSLKAEMAELRAGRDALRRQVITGILDASSVGVTIINTQQLEKERTQLSAACARVTAMESALSKVEDALIVVRGYSGRTLQVAEYEVINTAIDAIREVRK